MSVATELVPTVSIPARARRQAQPERPVRLASVTVLHAPRAVPVATSVRLTQRGVLVLALAVALLGVGLVWLARISAPQPAAGVPAPQSVTVRPGDTLWSIATRVAPNRDPRAEVAALQQRNRLGGVQLTPGQLLRVP